MKKIFLIISIFISLVFLASSVLAEQESSPGSDLTDKIKERLQETAEEGIQTAKDEIEEKTNRPKKKAFIGNVDSTSDTTINLVYKEQKYTINYTDSTVFEKSPGKKKLEADDIKSEDFLIAMGFVTTDDQSLDAKRVLSINQPISPKSRQLLSGKIKEIDGNKVSFNSKTITISSKTDFTIKDVDKPTIDDLQLEDNLFTLVILDKNGDIGQVKKVFVLPGKNNPASQEPTNADTDESTESAETESDSAEVEE